MSCSCPSDIGPWEDDVGAVQNALVDDEIGALIDGLRAKGADVWAVFDSCHSGTVTRGVEEDDVRMRQVPPDALGIPAEAMEVQTRAMPDPRAAAKRRLTMRAARHGQLSSPSLPRRPRKSRRKRTCPRASRAGCRKACSPGRCSRCWRNIPAPPMARSGRRCCANTPRRSWRNTTPMFEGDLDAVAFSGTRGARVAQWAAGAGDDGFADCRGQSARAGRGRCAGGHGLGRRCRQAALGHVKLTAVDTFAASAGRWCRTARRCPRSCRRG